MLPDAPWAEAQGSFPQPLPVPTVDPDASPLQSLSINCQWLLYIRGALWQLVQQATWDTEDPAVLLLAQQRAMTLIAMITECASVEFPFACPYDFRVFSQSAWTVSTTIGDFTPPPIGHFTPFIGFVPDPKFSPSQNAYYTQLDIQRTWPTSFQLNQVKITFDFFHGNNVIGGGVDAVACDVLLGGTSVAFQGQLFTATPDGTGQTVLFNFAGVTVDEVICGLTVGTDAASNPSGSGSGRIFAVEVFGTATASPDCG